MIAVYVIIGIVVILLIVFVLIYNRLVNMHNQMKNLWAQVDVQLKRRHDLSQPGRDSQGLHAAREGNTRSGNQCT